MTVPGQSPGAVDICTDQIFHYNVTMPRPIPKRPLRHSADMLFELIHRTTILCPMSRIMNARCNFIYDQTLRSHEKLQPHNSYIVERVHYLGCQLNRVCALGRIEAGRKRRGVQNTVVMNVFARVKTGNVTARAARSDDRDFMRKGHKAL